MKKFPYPMRRVHDARVALLNRCEALLAQAERKRLASLQHKERCITEIRKQSEVSTISGQHDAATLLRERHWFEHLMHQLDHAIHHCSEHETLVNEKRNELQKTLQDCKIIENLTQRQKKQWTLQEIKTEQQEQDENAVMSYARKRQGYHPIETPEHVLQREDAT